MSVRLLATVNTSPVPTDFYSGALTICVGIVIAVAVKRLPAGRGLQLRLEHWADVLALGCAMVAAGQSLRGLATFQQNHLSGQSVFAITLFTSIALVLLVVPFLVHSMTSLTEEAGDTSSSPARSNRPGKQPRKPRRAKTQAGVSHFASLPHYYQVVVISVALALAFSFMWVPIVEVGRWFLSLS